MNKQKFFAAIRQDVTGGKLSTTQVIGFEYLLDLMVALKLHTSFVAYVLATAYWETARTMEPVREAYWLSEDWRRKNLRYFPWYGRGFVQLTWEANYAKAQDWFRSVLKRDVPLTKDPDLALDRENSAFITIVGMVEGWFTKKKLADYLDPPMGGFDHVQARRIVNGTDKMVEIGRISVNIEKALEASGYAGKVTEPDFTAVFAKPIDPVKPAPTVEYPDGGRPITKVLMSLGVLGIILMAILEGLGVL